MKEIEKTDNLYALQLLLNELVKVAEEEAEAEAAADSDSDTEDSQSASSFDEENEDAHDEDDDEEELDDYAFDDDDDDDEERITFEESLAFLEDMVGMEHIKQKLLRLGRYVQWKKKLEAVGIDTSKFPEPNLTFMFLGDPGTGKTTVARHMGNILYSLGLLSSNEVMEFRREDLIGQNYGSEEEYTKDALNRSQGKIFFLDEAYQCFKNGTDKRDPGYHILETLMAHFGSRNRCIIMAGYKAEMQELFSINPGFRSRIPDENIIEFTRPTEQLLMDVATNEFEKMEFFMEPEANTLLRQHIHSIWTSKDRDFGNARTIRQLAESIVINHANRIMTTTECDDFVITHDDINQSLSPMPVKTITRARIGFV